MTKDELKKIIDREIKNIGPIIRNAPWSDRTFYSNWCAQTYKYVCLSAPLIKKTADSLPEGELKQELEKHYQEEVGHEKFAQRDAEFFDVNAEACDENEETKHMYSYADQSIDVGPESMYGYAFALEHISKVYAPWIADKVLESFDIEATRFHKNNIPASFLTLHAEVDQEHADCGLEALEKLPTETHERVLEVMLETFRNYANFIQGVERSAQA